MKINSKKEYYVMYNNKKYYVTGHFHTHPPNASTVNNPIGFSTQDNNLLHKININIYVIYKNEEWQAFRTPNNGYRLENLGSWKK